VPLLPQHGNGQGCGYHKGLGTTEIVSGPFTSPPEDLRPVVPDALTTLRPWVDLGVAIMKPGARVTSD